MFFYMKPLRKYRRGPSPAPYAFSILIASLLPLLLPSCGWTIGTRASMRRSEVVMADSLSQYGITWTFDKERQTGSFANGDKWVVGPVDIIEISPAPAISGGRIMNGSMLNPAMSYNQGYDNRMFGTDYDAKYLPSLNAAMPGGRPVSVSNPLKIAKPSSLVSGISTLALSSELANQVRTMAVLTILDEVPPADSFRPPYVGTDKTVRFRADDLDYGLLPNLPVPASAPPIKTVAARFERPWIEHMIGWIKECFLPRDNMPNYGREIAACVSDGAMSLMLDYSRDEKEPLAVRMVQLGIDYYAIINQDQGRINWRADGGHMSGRAFPILFAGLMLDDEGMKSALSKSGDYAYQNGYYEGKLPPDYVHFGELDQTFYVTQRDYDRTNGVNPGLYGVWSPDTRAAALPYTASDVANSLAEWGVEHVHNPTGDNRSWVLYRGVTGVSWSGFVLASRILGIRQLWNHQALFDYMDRYMAYPGNENRAYNEFQAFMWDNYRSSY
jgi:hypothetical protein